MGRDLEFDISKAKNAATQLFWSKGYQAATLELLCEYMDISRSSFYATLGDKRTLFIACVQVYHENWRNEFSKISTLDQLKQLAMSRFVDSKSPKAHIGCMLINTATEMADVDDELVELLQKMIKIGTQCRVEFFQRMGCSEPQAVRLGQFYQVFVEGLLMSSRRRVPKQKLKSVIETAFAFIESDINQYQTV